MKSGWRSLATLLVLGGFWCSVVSAQAGKLRVLTSFLPMYCFTVNVAGDLAEVENLLPGTVGPHDYQFTPRDRLKLAKADLIVVNGLGLEAWLESAIGAGDHKLTVVEASAGLESQLIPEPELHTVLTAIGHHPEKDFNPHIWLDPQMAQHAVTNILQALQRADAPNAAAYARNATAYLERLQKLDAELNAGLAPVRDIYFVTYHNAFPYFIRRYQLKLAGVMEETPDVDPSPRYLIKLSQSVRTKQARALFVEPQFSSALAEQLAKDLKLKLGELDTMETGKFTATAYEDIMRANLRALLEDLK